MTLHLGGNTCVLLRKIVAVLDLTNASASQATKEFIQTAREEGFVKELSEPPFKSGILAADKAGYVLYLSPITASTLALRAAGADEESAEMLANNPV